MKKLLLLGALTGSILAKNPVYICTESIVTQADGSYKVFNNVRVPVAILPKNLLIYITDDKQYVLDKKDSDKTTDGVPYIVYGSNDESTMAAVYDKMKQGVRIIFRSGGEVRLSKCKYEKDLD